MGYDCDRLNVLLFFQAKSNNLFVFPYRWLVLFDGNSTKRMILSTLREIPLLITSDLVLAEKDGDRYTLVEREYKSR